MTDPSVNTSCQPQIHRLLHAARPLDPVRPGKIMLPLSSGVAISPGPTSFIRGRSQINGLLTSRVLVADPQKWRISSLRTGPRIGGCQVRGDHPALSDPGPESVTQLPPLSVDDGVELEIAYVGPEVSGESLVACLCAESATEGRGTLGQAASKNTPVVSFLAESPPVSPGEKVCLPLPPRALDFYVSGLTLRVADPTHWLVNDVLVNNDTLLVESGEFPGELLADRPGRVALRLGRLRAREDLIVQATYTGPLPSVSLAYEVSGSEVPTSEAAADSAFLAMSSGDVPILSSARVQGHVGLPKGYAFLPEEVILRDPEKWIVNDVQVGVVSQFACSGDVPGTVFGARTRGCQPSFSAVPGGGTNFVLVVTYVGSNTGGDPFICGVSGRVVRLPVAQGTNI